MSKQLFNGAAKKKALLIFLLISGISFIMMLLLRPIHNDGIFHINRIVWLADSYKAGDFLPMMYASAYNYAGYPLGIFYPDLFIRPFAFLVSIGCPEYFTYCLMFFLINFGTLYVMYYFGVKTGVTHPIAFAVAYYIFPWRLYVVFIVQAIGLDFSYLFAPFIFYGAKKTLKGEWNWWFPFGMFAILHCHLISSLLFAVALVVYYLFHCETLFKDRRVVLQTVLYAILVTLASIDVILPLIDGMKSIDLLCAHVNYYGARTELRQLFTNGFLNFCKAIQFPGRYLFLLIFPWMKYIYDESKQNDFTQERPIYRWNFLESLTLMFLIIVSFTCFISKPYSRSICEFNIGCGLDYVPYEVVEAEPEVLHSLFDIDRVWDESMVPKEAMEGNYIATYGKTNLFCYPNYEVTVNGRRVEYKNKAGFIYIPGISSEENMVVHIQYVNSFLQRFSFSLSLFVQLMSLLFFVVYHIQKKQK